MGTEPTAAEIAEDASRRGATAHTIFGASTKNELLDAIGAALDFPAHYGRNLDALHDMLRDLSWQPAGEHVLIVVAPEGVDPAVRDTLDDAARAATSRPLTVVITRR